MSYGFSSKSCMNVRVWPYRRLSTEEFMLQIVALEKTLESPLNCKEIKPVHPKGNQSWIFIGRTDTNVEVPIFWPLDVKNWIFGKDPDAGKDWKAGGEGNDRGWDGWMASLTRWMWVLASSRRWWRTWKSGMLQSMGSQRVGHNWACMQHNT